MAQAAQPLWTNWSATFLHRSGIDNLSYPLEVQEFVLEKGDLTCKFWYSDGHLKTCPVPQYAISNPDEAIQSRLLFVKDGFRTFIECSIIDSNELIRYTFEQAFQYSNEAETEEQRAFLEDILQLWVAARMSSTTEWLCDNNLLGMEPVNDPTSPYHGHVPISPVMSKQLQIIAVSNILGPLDGRVVMHLKSMMEDTKKNWFALYLTTFISLHICALVTKRDEEYASQTSLSTRFTDPLSMSQYHRSVVALLLEFHHSNNGAAPFTCRESSDTIQELKANAELSEDQIGFLQQTAELVQKWRETMNVQEGKDFSYDYRFIVQLYDTLSLQSIKKCFAL